MIHHVSLEADNPMKVATVIAQIMGGRVQEGFPFEDACAAMSGDNFGTMIECYQRGKVLAAPKAGSGRYVLENSETLQEYQAFHTALSVAIDDEAIMEIAKAAGWKTGVRSNGPFSVVEVWIENRLLLEVLSPTQSDNYLKAMT